jgi:chemotaxis protein MotB|tara:strand:+ start:4761 stop:5432 length:672 start_codon:yes stop_codon:yes gene_type:complete
MGKNRKTEEEAPAPAGAGWITTYADMITLLMCFFVIMYSASEPSQSKWEQLKGGIESDIMDIENPTPLADLYEILEAKYDDPEDDDPDLTIDFDNRGIVISLGSHALFNSGGATLGRDGLIIAEEITDELKSHSDRYALVIDVEGHTDDVPMRSSMFPSNWELSSSRSASVVRVFTDGGISEKVVRAVGHADSYPLVPNRDSLGVPNYENMAINRRVDVIIHY